MPDPALQLHINAGPHDRTDCPLLFRLPEVGDRIPIALSSATAPLLPVQRVDATTYAVVLPLLRATADETLTLVTAGATAVATSSNVIEIDERDEPGNIEIRTHGDLLTRYVFGNVRARPYFFPLLGPGGSPLTRSYPMTQDVANETHDHPHHRSLWIAHGDVNGADNWSEEPGHGHTRHHKIEALTSGPVYGSFKTSSVWESAAGAPLLTQHLHVTAWAASDAVRLLDFGIDLTAHEGQVVFGDTKEGGILSVRVASSLDVPRGGRITNTYGGIDEAETWGRSAHWCDYSGLAGDRHCGLAVLDHPLSFRHPTTWHVRNYGLMTANPFGYAAFTNGEKNGAYILNEGDTLRFRYRVVLHRGDAVQANIAGHYLNFACPPTTTVSGTAVS